MSELRKGCERTVWDGMRRYPCQKSATRPADAPRWCAVHDPIAKAEREAKRTAAFNAKWEAERAARQSREQAEAERNRKAELTEEALALLAQAETLLGIAERDYYETGEGDRGMDCGIAAGDIRAFLARADSEAGG